MMLRMMVTILPVPVRLERELVFRHLNSVRPDSAEQRADRFPNVQWSYPVSHPALKSGEPSVQ